MDKITDLLNNFSLEKYIPKLDTLTGWVQWLISLAIRVGPICILVLGLIYLLIPPKEANRKAGYRTYFGMGSVVAWRFTQLVSGILMTVIGLVLMLVANGTVKKLDGMDLIAMADTAFGVIRWQIICALFVYVVMFLLTAVMFNRKGVCRFGRKANEALDALFLRESKKSAKKNQTAKETLPASEEEIPQLPPEPEEVVEYEKQGEQVITADDIVIEGLD